MENRIAKALSKFFERHRIVFWYDTKKELRSDFDTLCLDGIERIELNNNEYGLKYRLLRELPEQKFLLYREGPQPNDLDNWLLDVQLAHGEFRTDQVAIWLSELELGPEFCELMQLHSEFFQAQKSKDALKKLFKPEDTVGQLRMKMLGVCVGCEPRLDTVVENLLQELAENKSDKIKLVGRCRLDGFLWEQMKRSYGYKADEPSIQDFTIELFKSCYHMGTEGQIKLTYEALVFLKRWKDSRQFERGFEIVSDKIAKDLDIEKDLVKRDFRDLIDMDYFRIIDKKLSDDLLRAVASRTISSTDVANWVRQRRQGHWYKDFRHLYETADYASQFIQALADAKLAMDSLVDGVQRYSSFWFRLDQLYRKFIYHMRMAGQPSLTSSLADQIENLYSNNYLMKLGDLFQTFVDLPQKWDSSPVPLQRNFFEGWVRPFLLNKNKVCVIISDALRYEIGDELVSLIRQEDRYSADLEVALSMLPSYTQLGMAALLPNKELAIVDNHTGTVLVDGKSSQGTENRIKILNQAIEQRTTACKADELMAMKGNECRALLRDHEVIYIYHNHIDATGDKKESEERVFEAVEETLKELIRLIKKLTAANANNLLITSDHGFIYQNRAIEESDFSSIDADGEKILFKNRRFVLGKGLSEVTSLRKFTSAQLGLSGPVEVQIPKSINRLRLKGSGSRYVHGGASLQEVVIPVIKINKKRQSDVTRVEVEIIRGASSVITSGQLTVDLYQASPVTEKNQPRVLRAGIYTEAGTLISDCHNRTFDLTSENPRDRELRVCFVLSRNADEANEQEVFLKLEEKLSGTSHYKEYKSLRYIMRRSFSSDFDY